MNAGATVLNGLWSAALLYRSKPPSPALVATAPLPTS